MPINKLFDSWTWNRTLPAPFDDPSIKPRQNITSKYSAGKTKHATLHPAVLKALLAYAKLQVESSKGSSLDGLGAIGNQSGKMDIVEYQSGDGKTHIVVYNRQKGSFTGGKIDSPTSMNISPYTYKETESTGTALMLSLLPKALEDDEMQSYFIDFTKDYTDGFTDLEKSAETAAILCDNLYYRVKGAATLGENGIPVKIPNTMNILPLNALTLTQGTYSPNQVTLGEFTIMKPGVIASKTQKKIDHNDFIGAYKIRTENLTTKVQKLVPQIASWYVIPPEVETVCKHILYTTKSEQPMRNFLLRGPSGTGKTEGAKAIAAGLGLPYMYITCSANTEVFDLVGQILPDTDTKNSHNAILPSFDDIRMDPSTAYFNLTGQYDDEITEEDVFDKLVEVMGNNADESKDSGKQKFTYVETDLVKAMRSGYVIEIQEPTVISNPGVLVGLNALLDRCNSVTLPTGERIERHPDTVVIITTNISYEGCKNLNQSVLSRMNLVIDVDEPSTDTLVKRVLGITGCTDKAMVKKMANVLNDIIDKCKNEMITDGSMGVRELISWVQSYMIVGDALEAAKYTIMSAVSSDIDNREEIYSSCIEPIFAS